MFTAGLINIARLTTIRELNLSHCKGVTDASLAGLGQLSRLHRLSLEACTVGDAGVCHMSGLTQLASLNLSWCNISGQSEWTTPLCVLTVELALSYLTVHAPAYMQGIGCSSAMW